MSGIFRRIRHPELREIYLEQERTEQGIGGEVIKPDSNCIDIGSHIGSSEFAYYDYAPQGKHIAFEPVPEKALWLRRKFLKWM